jgi:hypothetical protein
MTRINGVKQNIAATRYVHADWPAMYYSGPNGETDAHICNGPAEVKDGWHDSPAKFNADGTPIKDAVTVVPGKAEADAGAATGHEGNETIGLPAYDDITAKELKERLDEAGIPYGAKADKAELYEELKLALEV